MEIIKVELLTYIIVTDMEGKYQDIQTAHGLWYTPVRNDIARANQSWIFYFNTAC